METSISKMSEYDALESENVAKHELTVLQMIEKQITSIRTKSKDSKDPKPKKTQPGRLRSFRLKQSEPEAEMPENPGKLKKSAFKQLNPEKSKNNKENKITQQKTSKELPPKPEVPDNNVERPTKRPSKKLEKGRRKQTLLKMVHTGQNSMVKAGPLTPIIDVSPRNSAVLTSNSENSTPIVSPMSTPPPKKMAPLKWEKSDSEGRYDEIII